ncbi:MAG: FtsX-like permease family protein [Bdellovibrionales bacterium]
MLAWLFFKNYLLSKRSGALVRIIAWHCIIGVAMGVAALIVVLSIMNGFNLTIRSRMLSVEPHLVMTTGKETTSEDRRSEIYTRLESQADARIERMDRYESQDLILRTNEGLFGGAVAKGYTTETLQALMMRVWEAGRKTEAPPSPESAELGPRELIVGTDLARSLGIFEGDEVVLIPPETLLLPKGEIPRLQKFKVKSLLTTQSPELDAKLLYYNMDRFPDRMRSLSVDRGYEIRLRNPYLADSVKKRAKPLDLDLQTWGERDTSLFFALKMESWAMTLFLSLAVLITSFSIVIVMILLLSQKRQDIGLLMAMGLSRKRVKWIFLRVGLYLSFLGILSGVVVGTSISLFLDYHPIELLPDIYTDSTLPAKLSGSIFLFVFISTSLIAVLGAWLPVWRYGVSTPAQGLRRTPVAP